MILHGKTFGGSLDYLRITYKNAGDQVEQVKIINELFGSLENSMYLCIVELPSRDFRHAIYAI
jgi:hypothetical protein